MFNLTKVIHDPDNIVSKLIFEGDNVICEAVAYRFEDRGVICFSVQSGCRIGCSFCGTGKKFLRNLSTEEMLMQIEESLKVIGPREKIQLMSMSMGEPLDNWDEVKKLIEKLDGAYSFYLSTVGISNKEAFDDIIKFGEKYKNFGLQFSLHCGDNEKRKKLLGRYPYLLSLAKIKEYALNWHQKSGRNVYFNYICKGNETIDEARRVYEIVRGNHLTCSVLCNTKKFEKGDIKPAQKFADMILSLSNGDIDVSLFDPAGQDTIGGGCGQLLYVQEKMKEAKI